MLFCFCWDNFFGIDDENVSDTDRETKANRETHRETEKDMERESYRFYLFAGIMQSAVVKSG